MFTDQTHLRTEDPGHTENNPVFIYLEAFATDDHFKRFYPEFPNLTALEAAYRKGGIGDVRVKQFLAAVLNDVLSPIRARRHEWEKKVADVYRILEEGSQKAEAKARQIAIRARRAMQIDYFENHKNIEKQQKAYLKAHAQEEAYQAYLAKQKH